MKKILIWETLAIIGGGQKITLIISDMLRKSFEVFMLVPKKGPLTDELEKRGIPYICVGDYSLPHGRKGMSAILRYIILSLRSVLGFIRLARKVKPDLIYIPGPAALPWGAIGGQMINIPVVWHLHHVFIDSKTKILLNLFAGWKIVKRIISVSDSVGSQIVNKKGFQKRVILYNPIDAAWYSSGNSKIIEEELGLTKRDALWIGHIGILQPLKRQDFVIRVVHELLKRGFNVHGIFAGSAREETKDYELKLYDLINSMGLSSNIHMLGQRKDINNILASLDFLIIPSLEGFPLVGLEALAAGVPIVAYNDGGAGEIVDMSCAGITYDKYDDEIAAADIIEELIQKEKREGLSYKGKEFALRHSYDQYEQIIMAEFNACINNNK